MISCILLSAGESKRFGEPKACARLNNQTVIESILNRLISTNINEVVVVLGHNAESIKSLILNHNKVKVVYNKDYKFGQTSSFQAGLRQISKDVSGIMLHPIDFPLIRSQTINDLVDEFDKNDPDICIPAFQGKKGHPPIFHKRTKQELLELEYNTVARKHQEECRLLDVDDEGVLLTFNTPEEFERLKTNQNL